MKLIINGHEYDATHYSEPSSIILVHKTTAELKDAYDDFRAVEAFTLDDVAYDQRRFLGVSTLESGGNIQATYQTKDVSGIDRVMEDKALAYDILMGEESV